MSSSPDNPTEDHAVARGLLGAVLFCTASGAGIGVFLREPVIGAIAGAVVGLLLGVLLVPSLMRSRD